MASIQFDINSAQVTALQRTLLNVHGQFNWVAARAMTNAAKDTREAIRARILPMVEGGATTWTRRGLIVKFARPNDLTAMAGFQYGEGNWSDTEFTRKRGGIAAGRYMGVNASGGDRRPKSSELQLRRAGIIGNDQFLTPADGVRRDRYGNVPGGTIKSILSNVQAFTAEGSSQNTTRRSGGYFLMRRDEVGYSRQLDAEPAFIAQRIGRGKRGFKPAFFITDQPNYERRFPIQSVAQSAYRQAFPRHFQKGVQEELWHQFNKQR